ncbi:Rossmann-like and DUF2520 domain-containing protein [Marinoscillum furvescens]|uniref:Putative short-subunit dehydrogenase-like oxidoreductase (DUF2520 family) n=1 Tax=Marinoscillum furvescens DSM 4134 TaxID=1122208 RepID=A0A3D9L9G6_MARFU|nr:Rossmann-like and DUF2520 domain-containing protein [Marinoscillum furvescens]REE01702.1 putative short-subunit dehydrogenase-like oxidoreductase (DUF2520 family) [Marinoscillum furvescens DSM 4134]
MQPKIAIYGTGNLAFHLAKRLAVVGRSPDYIVSRSRVSGESFIDALQLSSDVCLTAEMAGISADFILLAVPDAVLQTVLMEVAFPKNSILLHTSGAQPMKVLATHERYGVLYPLQTFTKSKPVDWSQIPVFVEGNNAQVQEQIADLAKILSPKVKLLTSDVRLRVHLAAVLANNFTNHLFVLADELLASSPVALNDLQHLIQETVDKAMRMPPAQAQTGPAVRGDHNTMDKHLGLLEHNPEVARLYELISKQIADRGKL